MKRRPDASRPVVSLAHVCPPRPRPSQDRAHRIGQKDAVNIHYLIAPNTLDGPMWGTISRKVSIVSTALNGASDKLHADVTQASQQLRTSGGAAAARPSREAVHSLR